jgi:hypothetical protein
MGHFKDSTSQFVAISRFFLGFEEFLDRHLPAVVRQADPGRYGRHE